MLEQSTAYQAAITADTRRMLLQALIEIVAPDITYGAATSNSMSQYSDVSLLHDGDFSAPARFATLERNRWLLDGSFDLLPDSPPAAIPFMTAAVSGDDGTFETPVTLEQPISNVTVLQALSVYFSSDPVDGIPEDFTVDVMQGGTAYATKEVTGNSSALVQMQGFTVNNPDAIRITVRKMTLPGRRFRAVEVYPGLYENWSSGNVSSFSVVQQANFSCLALPYGACSLSMDNQDRRFEPRNRQGIFKSIEERQGIAVSVGVQLEDGTEELKPLGVFYQFSGGWKTGDNGITMRWDLVDIVGLLANREFIAPDTLPTTLEGWAAALVAQLGINFEGLYTVDADYAALPVTVDSAEAVSSMNCGDILRYACMATGTWPRADASTGRLAIEPFWNQGNQITLDNMETYPVMKANGDLAAIFFTLSDGSSYVVSGNSTTSSDTVSVQNPFLHTQEQALTAARQILSTYGGTQLEVTGRGNPASEIGDVDTVQLSESNATTGRRMTQTLNFQNGVMRGCQSVLLQADGVFLYEDYAVLTTPQTWTAPSGAQRLRIVVVGGGAGGTSGTAGTWQQDGEPGTPGAGGRVLSQTIDINEGQTFEVVIGQGGGIGEEGGATTFGAYSSASGELFTPSFTDIATGNAYGRSGVKRPAANTGDGGAGGSRGRKGERHIERICDDEGCYTRHVTDVEPTAGGQGVPGASGCVLVFWDKEGAAE